MLYDSNETEKGALGLNVWKPMLMLDQENFFPWMYGKVINELNITCSFASTYQAKTHIITYSPDIPTDTPHHP